MAGHNKWSQIKHKKAKMDKQKGKLFSKAAREITVAAKQGGANLDLNPSLRLAVQYAKSVNMPNDNIQRAIDKGVGGGEGSEYEEGVYEGYGPNGVAILIRVLTDNKNRTASNVRAILSKAGGQLAKSGAVSYLFQKKGLFVFAPGANEEQLMDLATESGAEDIQSQADGSTEVYSSPDTFEALKEAFDGAPLAYDIAALQMIADSMVELDEDASSKLENLVEKLEDDDDVQEVTVNAYY